MDSIGHTNMEEIFSNGITTCVAPHDIAHRFFNELTDAERTEITDSFVNNQDIIGNGSCWCTFAVTDGRGVNFEYLSTIEYNMESKLVYLRATTLDVSIDSDSGIEIGGWDQDS
ncbi:MAG: hypothetical protein LBJ75_00020 [Puniceicoccales bacterium]|jgi:hypothetical protein|nr:hypothetical protein [Puniceicoccales bacterium]